MINGLKIILASASPRRRELLLKHGISFEVIVTDADESVPKAVPPPELVSIIARRKAEAAVSMCGNSERAAIIAADTVVYINGQIIGKPKDKQEAIKTLSTLSGNWHSVFTGICIAFTGDGKTQYKGDFCETRVKFRQLTLSQIEHYIDVNKPYDKAGAYAIQDSDDAVVENFDGDYENVIGLPVKRVLEIITQNTSDC